jgi:hypothetical protein
MRALIQVEGILIFVGNCDLINNKNWTVIKFGTHIAIVLRHLSVKHTSGIVECDFSIELKNFSFPHICLCELFLCFDVEEPNLEFCPRILAMLYVKKRENKYINKNCRQREMKMQKVMTYR